MFFFEWGYWQSVIKLNTKESSKKPPTKINSVNIPAYESDEIEALTAARLSASPTPDTRGPTYAFNQDILEMRCGMWQEKRGLITIISLAIIFVICIGFTGAAFFAWAVPYRHPTNGSTVDIGALVLSTYLGLVSACLALGYLKLGLPVSRLEIFTSRQLLIRFNRRSQQVYLHRPSYCGGLVTLPWIGVCSSGANSSSSIAGGIGLPLFLHWPTAFTLSHYPECAWVGKAGNSQSEIQAEWEFIRRFMDEGPEGLPRPRITSHFPWPWQAFTPQFEGLTHYFWNSSRIIKLGLILISPAFLILGLGHWLSLLLCWKPRWPKIIREAGLPGKPIPPLTTLADRPPHIQERLRANAHLWAIRPGQRPAKKPRATRRRAKPGNQSTTAKESFTDETHCADRPQT
ncbi:hypothetical protein PS623_02051 [Pseudomonas fluorescens]|uniref:DUF6708 domain-containing protein n=1 Tax=Pseudomonas fluorescens TaxID=294 RepID=UPI00125ADE56|nr:hypothetical protein [Pseudomonas fluorescens]VVM76832.1 hypothetical protein PS623_02051 [Pseudomonas fluorescens]